MKINNIPTPIVFKTIFPNGKISINQSWYNKSHYFGSGLLVKKAIKKYGKSTLKKEILRRCNDQEELDYWEKFYIRLLNTTNRKIGYNILPGSATGFKGINPMFVPECKEKMRKSLLKYYKNNPNKSIGRKASQETRDKLSKAHKGLHIGEKHPNYGKKASDITKKKISEGLKQSYKINGSKNVGKKRSEEYKIKRSIIMKEKGHTKGSKNYRAKLVLDIQTGIFYECLREACDAKLIKYSSGKMMLRGVYKNKTSITYV